MNKKLVECFADFETSKKLNELGFREYCFAFFEVDGEFKFNNGTDKFNNDWDWVTKNRTEQDYYTAPLWHDVEEWLKKNGINIPISAKSKQEAIKHIVSNLTITKRGRIKTKTKSNK